MPGKFITIEEKQFEVFDWTERYTNATTSPSTGNLVVGAFSVTLPKSVPLGAKVFCEDATVHGIVETISFVTPGDIYLGEYQIGEPLMGKNR